MSFFKTILDLSIKTSVYVGFAVYALVCITEIRLHLPVDSGLKLFIFFGTVLGYNFLKYIRVVGGEIFLLTQNRILILVISIATIGAFYFFIFLKREIKFAFGLICFFVFVYPFLRRYGLAKMLFVSFCVSIVTVCIPILNYRLITFDSAILLLQRFLILVSLLIPFEILDMKTDAKTLLTLPQKIGVRNTKILGLSFLLLFVALEFFKPVFDYISGLIVIITALFVIFSDPKNTRYYTLFWVESVPILWWILATGFLSAMF